MNPDYYDDDYNAVEGESLEVCTKDDDLDLHYDKIKILDQRNKGYIFILNISLYQLNLKLKSK